jgi:predicted ATPase
MRPLLELRTRNFRSLRRVSVVLRPLNVLVGPNESGKSNFLDVIEFLGDSVRDDLEQTLNRRGGYERVRYRGEQPLEGPVEIEVKAAVTTNSSPTAPDEYSLSFWVQKFGTTRPRTYLQRHEEFTFKRTRGRGRRITIRGNKVEFFDTTGEAQRSTSELPLRSDSLGLSTLRRLPPDGGGAEIARVADLFSTFRILDINVPAAREPSRISEEPLASDASNLASFLIRLRGDEERFEDLQDDARHMIPGLEYIDFEYVGGSTEAVAVRLVERGLRDPTDLADASYGTIRVLALLAALYDPSPPQLTCIEEVDHGLHPYIFDRLVERLREASERTQLLIATHSPALVNRLRPEELIVCERDKFGASRIPAISTHLIRQKTDQFDGQLRLGEIWFSGTLGGVPR